MLIGKPGVGKTSMVQRLMQGEFGNTSAEHGASLACVELHIGGRNRIVREASLPPGSSSETSMAILEADFPLAVVVVDGQAGDLEVEISEWCRLLDSREVPPVRHLVLARADRGNTSIAPSLIEKYGFASVVKTSAKDGSGFDELTIGLAASVAELEEELAKPITAVQRVLTVVADQLCKLVAENPNCLLAIEWRDLERIIATAVEEIGFKVTLTDSSKDGGKDVIASMRVGNEEETFFIEIKHWKAGGRPGMQHISRFIEVNAFEKTHGGLFLSTSGYSGEVQSRLAEISQQNVYLGDKQKIVSLCKTYVKSRSGAWAPEGLLSEILFDSTLGSLASH